MAATSAVVEDKFVTWKSCWKGVTVEFL